MYYEYWFYVYILTNWSKTLYTGVSGRVKGGIGSLKRKKMHRSLDCALVSLAQLALRSG